MNVDWAKLPALLWGVETIYDKVFSEKVFSDLENKLKITKNTLKEIEKLKTFNLEDDFKKGENLENRIEGYKKWIKRFKFFSQIMMTVLPTGTMLFILIKSLVEVLSLQSTIYLYAPSWLYFYISYICSWIIFVFSLQYLLRTLFTYCWLLIARSKVDSFVKEINIVNSRLIAPVNIPPSDGNDATYPPPDTPTAL